MPSCGDSLPVCVAVQENQGKMISRRAADVEAAMLLLAITVGVLPKISQEETPLRSMLWRWWRRRGENWARVASLTRLPQFLTIRTSVDFCTAAPSSQSQGQVTSFLRRPAALFRRFPRFIYIPAPATLSAFFNLIPAFGE